jgi:hypothetical protein
VVVLSAGAAALALATAAVASPPIAGGGTGTATSVVLIPVRTAGPNVFSDVTITPTQTGDLVLSAACHGEQITHGSGAFNIHASCTGTGTTAQCGTVQLEFNIEGTGMVTPPGVPVLDATAHAVRSSGAFQWRESLHYDGFTNTYTYTASYHC